MTDAADNQLVDALPFAVRTDARLMTAHIERVGQTLNGLDVATVVEELQRRHVAVTDDVAAAVADAVQAWLSGASKARSVEVAHGRPARHGQSGRVVFTPECDPELVGVADADAEQFNHYATHLITVRAGEMIAEVKPPVDGEDGVDVRGVVLPARKGAPAKFHLKGGCRFDEDRAAIVAEVDGTLHVADEEMWVSQGLHITGNVDFNTGHVDAPGSVRIDGHVADLFNVASGGDISIGDDVYLARVAAAGDVSIRGTLASGEKGIVLAGGGATIRAVECSTVSTGGDIHVAREAISARLFAGGSIDSPRAVIAGGIAAARGAVNAKVIGAGGQTPTLVLAGVDWMVAALTGPMLERVEKLEEQLTKREPALNTLKACIKRLTHAQREQVVELEFDYHSLLDERNENAAKAEAIRAAGAERCEARIHATDMIHAGVEIRLGNRVTRIEKDIPGPVTVQLGQVGDFIQIVARSASGALTRLKTGKVDPLFRVKLPEFPPGAEDVTPDGQS